MTSVASFRNLDFFIDWRCGAPGENEKPAPSEVTTDAVADVTVAGYWDERLRLSCRDRAEGQAEGTGWNRTRVFKREGQVRVELNGRALSTAPREFHAVSAPVSIKHEGGVMTLANLFVRERQ